MATILDRIIEYKRKEVAEQKKFVAMDVMVRRANEINAQRRSFSGALHGEKISVIAEIKKASPSKGVLVDRFVPAEIANEYQNAGAKALSVLTDINFFQGSVQALIEARNACSLPVLRKDFIIDEYQIYETKAIDADAFLLITAVLSEEELKKYIALANELNLECLVECHSEYEIEQSIEAGASIIGINNRDLRTFDVRLEHSIELKKYIPENIISVSESGIKSQHDVKKLHEAGFNAILVGEHLMKQDDRVIALNNLVDLK